MVAPISIAIANAADVDDYSAFLSALFAENLPTLVPRAQEPSREQVASFISTHDGRVSALVLGRLGGSLVGSLNLTRSARPQTEHVVHVGLNVAKAWRGQGVGRTLLTHALEWAKTRSFAERLELEVLENNIPAIRLYEDVGFVKEGTKARAIKREREYLASHVYALVLEVT